MPTLGQVVAEYRDHLFVGRKAELLRAFLRRLAQDGIATLYVDGRTVRQSQTDLATALESGLHFPPLTDGRPSAVVLVDSYDAIATHDGWFRESFLSHLDSSVRIVIASRVPIDHLWRQSSGWAQLVRSLSLGPLTEAAAREYLARRGIHDRTLQSEIWAFSRGHALALCRGTDLASNLPTPDFASAPQRYLILQELARQIVDAVESQATRPLLEAAAIVRQFDESLLAALLGCEPAADAFDALARLSLVQAADHGIAIHDVARRILVEELRWRHPARYDELRLRARAFYAARYRVASAEDRPWLVVDWLSLSSRPIVQRLVFDDSGPGQLVIQPARPADQRAIGALREAWQGHLSSSGQSLFDQPADLEALVRLAETRLMVARQRDGSVAGYGAVVPHCRAALSLLQGNPFVAALLRARPGSAEPPKASSSPSAADTFVIWHLVPGTVAPGAVQSALIQDLLGLVARARRYLILNADPDRQELLNLLGFRPIPGASFEICPGGPSLRGLELDLRATSPERWIEAILDGNLAVAETSPLSLQPALQEVLSRWSDDRVLAASPLVRFANADLDASQPDQARSLRQLVSDAIAAALEVANEADRPALRALELAYLQRATSHERLAERLSVSRSTLYRMLHHGCQLVVAQLIRPRDSTAG